MSTLDNFSTTDQNDQYLGGNKCQKKTFFTNGKIKFKTDQFYVHKGDIKHESTKWSMWSNNDTF